MPNCAACARSTSTARPYSSTSKATLNSSSGNRYSDDTLTALGHQSHVLAQVPDSEVITVAIVAAKYFQNNQVRALTVLQLFGYLSGPLSVSRFNRRLHALADSLGELLTTGELFIVDSLPIPVCRRARARRCRKVRGREFCGYCAAKKEKFFAWRLHLVCNLAGQPVSFQLVPAAYHDLTAIHELTVALPAGAQVLGDKAFNSAADEASIFTELGVRLAPIRKANMAPNEWIDDMNLRDHRHVIENLNSQLESMGIERLHARTNPGLVLKLHASLIAATVTNAN